METPLHPTPMARPMMKGKIYVDASNKPTFQGIWGMTHADVNKGGHTNDFKVVRMQSVQPHELGMPVFAGQYIGYFKLTSGFQTETVNEKFTLTFRGHSNHGYNVYGHGDNRYGSNEIVGTVTQSGKMEIYKMLPGTTQQPDPNEPAPALPRPANPRAVSPSPPPMAKPFHPTGGGGGGARSKSHITKKKTPKKPPPPPPASRNGLPGMHVRILKDCLQMLKKSDKNNVFQFEVPPNFRGAKGVYADVIKTPMDLGTAFRQIESKYRTAMECIADVRLVFSNAKEFNPDTDPVNALAASLSGKFEAFVSAHRAALGLDGSTPTPAGAIKSPPSAASMALSTSAAALATGKRISTPPAAAAAVAAAASGAGGGVPKDSAASVEVLTLEQQEQLAKDVNELFRVGNANPANERAQARVYALWSFAKAYVQDKDRVSVDGGKVAEIRMDALNHVRQRQLRDVVMFFMEDSKSDPVQPPVPTTPSSSSSSSSFREHAAASTTGSGNIKKEEKGRASGDVDGEDAPPSGRTSTGKRPRSDISDSENEEGDDDGDGDDDDEDAEGDASPSKRSRDGLQASGGSKGASRDDDDDGGKPKTEDPSAAADSPFGRVDSSSLTLEATASTLEARRGTRPEIDIDLDDDEDEDEEEEGGGAGGAAGAGSGSVGEGSNGGSKTGKMDEQWVQAQAERKEREEREKARAESEKALEEQRLRQQAQREKERVEEGLRLSRERAAEKARVEAAALEKANREKKELEDKKEAERLAREGTKASVDLDQVRADSNLMELMDESIYDD
ncbi:unnamed protein product [Pylaiella littoralis]